MEWKPIETAPARARVIVAGWRPTRGSLCGHWWMFEDHTDKHGSPEYHKDAKLWWPFPEAPSNPGE